MKIHISCVPWGLALEHELSVVRAVAAWGRCSRKMGVSVGCLQPLRSMHSVPSMLLASSAQERQGLPKRPAPAPLAAGRRMPGWVTSPSPGKGQPRDNDRQVWSGCGAVLCPPGSRAPPSFPITRAKEGGRRVPFDHCLQTELLHAEERKSSSPPSSHVL